MSVYTSGVFTLRFSAFINVVLPLTHLICRGYSQEAPTKQIVALLGDDVVLPCSLERPVDVSQLQLEWARTDLTPGFIYVWDKNKENVDDKQPSYVGRTSLSFDKLNHGDVSLTLSKVQLSDKGLYRCFIPEPPQESFVDLVVGSFVVDVTQSSYQAEENHDITLEWTFTTKPDTPISALRILCSLNTDRNPSTLYHLHDGVKFSEDEEFSGRVQSDKDALREGRIRLQLSRLRTEDSGLYLCEVDTGYGRGYNSCRVTVSDFATILTTEISLQTPDHQDMTPTDDRSRVSVVAVVTLLLVALSLVLLHMSFVAFSQTKSKKQTNEHVVACCCQTDSLVSTSFNPNLPGSSKSI